jgi:hypothetical protein
MFWPVLKFALNTQVEYAATQMTYDNVGLDGVMRATSTPIRPLDLLAGSDYHAFSHVEHPQE